MNRKNNPNQNLYYVVPALALAAALVTSQGFSKAMPSRSPAEIVGTDTPCDVLIAQFGSEWDAEQARIDQISSELKLPSLDGFRGMIGSGTHLSEKDYAQALGLFADRAKQVGEIHTRPFGWGEHKKRLNYVRVTYSAAGRKLIENFAVDFDRPLSGFDRNRLPNDEKLLALLEHGTLSFDNGTIDVAGRTRPLRYTIAVDPADADKVVIAQDMSTLVVKAYDRDRTTYIKDNLKRNKFKNCKLPAAPKPEPQPEPSADPSSAPADPQPDPSSLPAAVSAPAAAASSAMFAQ